MPRYLTPTLSFLLFVACGGGTPEDTGDGAATPTTAAELTAAVPIPDQDPIPYPPSLYAERIEGEVMLYLFIDATGAVVHDSTRIEQSSGRSEFDAAALQAAPSLRFVPARIGDSAVSAPIQVPIRFTLPDSLGSDSVP